MTTNPGETIVPEADFAERVRRNQQNLGAHLSTTDIDRASPPGTGPWPAVVMIHEIFGLDEVMRGHADRLAGFGYLTLAVDLFSAGGTARCLVSTMTAMMRGRGRAFADIAAAHDYLAGSPDCTGKIGVIGFCIGGGFALLSP